LSVLGKGAERKLPSQRVALGSRRSLGTSARSLPTVTDPYHLPFLLSTPAFCLPPCLLISRALMPSFAIRSRSAANSFAARALPPWLSIFAISTSDNFRALATLGYRAPGIGFRFLTMRTYHLALRYAPYSQFPVPGSPIKERSLGAKKSVLQGLGFIRFPSRARRTMEHREHPGRGGQRAGDV
jgi:hypothetical protein